MKTEVKVNVQTENFPDTISVPELITDCIFIPCWGENYTYYYFLLDFNQKTTTVFEIEVNQHIQTIKESFKQYKSLTGPHNMNFDQMLFWSSCPHQGEVFQNSVYISQNCTNYLLQIDIDSSRAFLITDENSSPLMVYSSTNTVVDNCIYTSRWNFGDMYNDLSSLKPSVDLEIVKYHIRDDRFELIDMIAGSDQIHTTSIFPDKRHLIMIEMNTTPSIHTEDITKESIEKKKEIYNAGLIDSQCYIYDLIERTCQKLSIQDCPAHIVFDCYNPNVAYISQHNLGVVTPNNYCFGPATISKYQLTDDGSLKFLDAISDEGLIRCPGHSLYHYNDMDLIITPVTPSQLYTIDSVKMDINGVFSLHTRKNKFDFSEGPVAYPFMIVDRTPYSANPIHDTPYIYLNNIVHAGIYNILNRTYECNFRFNPGHPIIGCGHSTRLNH